MRHLWIITTLLAIIVVQAASLSAYSGSITSRELASLNSSKPEGMEADRTMQSAKTVTWGEQKSMIPECALSFLNMNISDKRVDGSASRDTTKIWMHMAVVHGLEENVRYSSRVKSLIWLLDNKNLTDTEVCEEYDPVLVSKAGSKRDEGICFSGQLTVAGVAWNYRCDYSDVEINYPPEDDVIDAALQNVHRVQELADAEAAPDEIMANSDIFDDVTMMTEGVLHGNLFRLQAALDWAAQDVRDAMFALSVGFRRILDMHVVPLHRQYSVILAYVGGADVLSANYVVRT